MTYRQKERVAILSCINQLQFFKKNARWGSKSELAMFWVESGQAKEFAEAHGHNRKHIHIKDPANGSEWEE